MTPSSSPASPASTPSPSSSPVPSSLVSSSIDVAATPPDADAPTPSQRLDRLDWAPFHTRSIGALGITWILDGLEVTLAGAVGGALAQSESLRMSESAIGMSATLYLLGAVAGALIFGWLADRMGRKKLFFTTLALYLCATFATAFSTSVEFFLLCRFLTGAGIGGEYAAINSAIQELVPARYRGRTDLIVNGSFWIGAGVGAVASIILLRPGLLPPDIGWRSAFVIGAVTGLFILFLRREIPESPRWLVTRGRVAEAHAIVDRIVESARRGSATVQDAAAATHGRQEVASAQGVGEPSMREPLGSQRHPGMRDVLGILVHEHPRRTLVGMALMASQAFFYNAIFFTYALVLGRFYDVPADHVGWYLLPFAFGNVAGPLVLGRFFDTVGRRKMISLTYAVSGLLLLVTAWLFARGHLSAVGQTAAWTVTFFFASAAASSAYLTVAESFPLQIRGLAIALFYAFGTGIGGAFSPWLFGLLIGTGERDPISWGYTAGAALMLYAAWVQWKWGLDAEGRSLEDLAQWHPDTPSHHAS